MRYVKDIIFVMTHCYNICSIKHGIMEHIKGTNSPVYRAVKTTVDLECCILFQGENRLSV